MRPLASLSLHRMPSYAAAFPTARPDVCIVGAGAVGGALAQRLHARGYPVLAVLSRTLGKAEAVGRAVDARVVSDSEFDLPPSARIVLVCVPDDAIGPVAARLAAVPHAWERTVVAHTSGALPAARLRPLAERGARTLSFHPLQSFASESPPEALDGVYVGLEGEPQAVAAGVELAVNLGMRYLVLTAEAKARYHLAASMASNYLVTLLGVVQQVLGSLDVDRATAMEVVQPLVRGTLDNLARSCPEDALTGPIARGDLDTLRQHGLALRRYFPHLVPFYAALAAETVPLAVRSSRLDPARAEEVLALLERMVTLPLPVAPGAEPAPSK